MGIYENYDREQDILQEQLDDGRITREEFDEAVQDLEQDMRDIMK